MEGIQQALVDVLLLADCPVLIGTYYSSYSETAKLIGWPYYVQVSPRAMSNPVHAVIVKSCRKFLQTRCVLVVTCSDSCGHCLPDEG